MQREQLIMDPPPSIILILSLLFWSWSGALIVISSSPVNADTLNDTTITTTTEPTLVVQNNYESNENLTTFNVTTTRTRRHFMRLFNAPRRMIVIGAAIPKDGPRYSWSNLKEAMDHEMGHVRSNRRSHNPFSSLWSMMTHSAESRHESFLTESQRAFAAINDDYPEALRLRLSRAVRSDRGLRGLVKVDPRGVSCRDVCTPNSIGFGLIGFCTNVYCECGPLPFPARQTRANFPEHQDDDDQDWIQSVSMEMRENRMLNCPGRQVFDPDRLKCQLPERTNLCSDFPAKHHQHASPMSSHEYFSNEHRDQDQDGEGDEVKPTWTKAPDQKWMPWMPAVQSPWPQSKSRWEPVRHPHRQPNVPQRLRASGEKLNGARVPSSQWNSVSRDTVTTYRPPMHLDYPAAQNHNQPTPPSKLFNSQPKYEPSLSYEIYPEVSSQVIYGVPLTTTESTKVSNSTPTIPPPAPTYLPPPTATTTERWAAPTSASTPVARPKLKSSPTPSSKSKTPNNNKAAAAPRPSSTSKAAIPVYLYTLKTAAAVKGEPSRSRKRPHFVNGVTRKKVVTKQEVEEEEDYDEFEDYRDFVKPKPGAILSEFGYGFV